MAGILHGQAAVNELRKQLGRDPTDIETQIAMEEGYSKDTYRDTNNVLTSGWGQTGDNMGLPLDEVALKYAKRTQKLIPNYNTLPDFVKNRAFDAAYRGTLGQSPMTVNLMNAGQYGDAADEFLNNQEYRDAVISGSGVAARMERTADAFREYGNQKPKQVVPEMNKVDPKLLYGQNSFLSPAAQAALTQAQGDPRSRTTNRSSVPPMSMPSVDPRNRTTNRSNVPPAAMPAVIDMNGGQVDPRVPKKPNTYQPVADWWERVGGRQDQYKLLGEEEYKRRKAGRNYSDPSEEALMQQEVVPSNKPLSDANMRQSQYVKQQGDLEAKKASDLARYKAEYEAYASDLKSKGASPKSFDRWKTEKTWEENNAQMAEAKAEKLATSIASAQNSYDIFINGGGNADDITIEEWSSYDSKRRIMEMKKVDVAAAKALGGTGSTKDASRVNANIVPAITSTGEQHLRSQVDLSTVEKLEEDKKLKELAGEYNKQGDSQYPEGMRPIADAPVPPVQETIAELTKRLGEEYDNSQTDTPDASSVDVKRGIVKDGNGNVVDVPPGQVQGIFNKASELFGDMFTAADLKRMVLYTVGGLVTGGSMEGSFKWAGMQVMKEHSANEQNQATKDAAALVVKERQDAVLRADGVRAKEAYIDAGLKARAEEVKVKANTATAANLANYNLNKDLIEWKTKAPVQVKVPGRNRPVQARWNPNGYYVSARDNKTILNGGRNVEKWADGVYGKNAQRSSHIAAIEGIRTSYENEGDEPDLLGDRAANIYDKYLIKVDEWADEYGYTVDLSTALSRQVLSIAAKQSVEANRGKTKGFITPEHFFDTALLKGFVSSMGGSQKIFDANDGKPIDSAANEALIGHIKKMQQHGAKTGKNTTIASALGDVHKAWVGLEDSERKKYNNDVRKGNSGFAKFALEIKIPKPKN